MPCCGGSKKKQDQQGVQRVVVESKAADTQPASDPDDPPVVDGQLVPSSSGTKPQPLPPHRSTSSRTSGAGFKTTDYGDRREEADRAARKIAAVARGSRDRHQVSKRYHAEHRPRAEEAANPDKLGLGAYAEFNTSMPKVSDYLRYQVRDQTILRVLEDLHCRSEHLDLVKRGQMEFVDATFEVFTSLTEKGAASLSPEVQAQMRLVHIFVGGSSSSTQTVPVERVVSTQTTESRRQENYLLGQFDMVALPARADYDDCFDPLPGAARSDKAATAPAKGIEKLPAGDTAINIQSSPNDSVVVFVQLKDDKKANQKADTVAMVKNRLRLKLEEDAKAAVGFNLGPEDSEFVLALGKKELPDAKLLNKCGVKKTGEVLSVVHRKKAAAPTSTPSVDFSGWFWILHGAAPNIGESKQAEDFFAYSIEENNNNTEAVTDLGAPSAIPGSAYDGPVIGGKPPPGTVDAIGGNPPPGNVDVPTGSRRDGDIGVPVASSRSSVTVKPCWKPDTYAKVRRLDEAKYIRDMSRLWRNALIAMGKLQIEDAIFFPFGMGAFLRQLGLNDDRYEDAATMRKLRYRCAEELMAALCDICVHGSSVSMEDNPGKAASEQKINVKGPTRVHLCLVCVNAESIENHNCFLEAAAARATDCPKLLEVLQLRRNVDCLRLANDLSKRQASNGLLRVGVLNGANRKLLGNHWFQAGARFAIDENLHRRSATMTRASLLLNFACEPCPRKADALQQHVSFFNGTVSSYCGNGAVNLEGIAGGSAPKPVEQKKTQEATHKPSKGGLCSCCARRNSRVAPAATVQTPAAKNKEQPKAAGAAAGAAAGDVEAPPVAEVVRTGDPPVRRAGG